MKLNCGPTRQERRQIRKKELVAYYTKLFEEGETVFAFLPVRIGPNRCVWLEKVHRKAVSYTVGSSGPYGPNEAGSKYESIKGAAEWLAAFSYKQIQYVYTEL